MGVSYFNPYWQKALQYQQRNQQQQRQQPRQVQRRPGQPRDDFGHEWLGKDVEAEQVKGSGVVVIRGRVVDVSKYWLKIAVDGQTLYVNKAFILSIKPVEIESGGSGEGYVGRKQ
jgi:RNase P/RNase MRP subunit p29